MLVDLAAVVMLAYMHVTSQLCEHEWLVVKICTFVDVFVYLSVFLVVALPSSYSFLFANAVMGVESRGLELSKRCSCSPFSLVVDFYRLKE